MSEDLDFGYSLPADTPRSKRRKAIAPFKEHFAGISARLPCFQIAEALRGYNDSSQYNGRLSYQSIITGEGESIKVEVSLRELLLVPPQRLIARTMLSDPNSGEPAVPQIQVQAISFHEAYAEKTRAALTRDEPAIRDFFDIDRAVQKGRLSYRDQHLLDLAKQKLALPGNRAIDLSAAKLARLAAQIEGQLRPVLRAHDFVAFDLSRVVGSLQEVASVLLPLS